MKIVKNVFGAKMDKNLTILEKAQTNKPAFGHN